MCIASVRRVARLASPGLAALLVAALLPVLTLATTPTAVAATPVGKPVLAEIGSGTEEMRAFLFVRGANGTVWHRRRDASGEWANWVNTGRAALGDPAVARYLDRRLAVFARGADRHLWQRAQNTDGTWRAWRDLGAPAGVALAGDPVVVANDNTAANARATARLHVVEGNTDGRLEVFVRGGDGGLWHRAEVDPNGTRWTAWEKLGSGLAADPTAAVSGDGRIALFATGTDGRFRHRAQSRPGAPGAPGRARWAPWRVLDVPARGTAAAAVNTIKAGSLLQVFVNGTDGRLWTVTQTAPGTPDAPNGTWAAPSDLGAAFASDPVVVSSLDNRLSVFGIRAGVVAYRSQTASAPAPGSPNGIWDGRWPRLGGHKVNTLGVVASGQGRLEVFAANTASGTLFHRPQLAAGVVRDPRGVWLGWTDMGIVTADPCATPRGPDCLLITNVDLNRSLDLQVVGSTTYVSASAPSGAASQRWMLRRNANSSFSIESRSRRGQCVHELSEFVGPFHLQLKPCDGSDMQQYYLEPVAAGGTGAKPAAFRVRQTYDRQLCLTAMNDQKQVERKTCNGTDANDHDTWRVGTATANVPQALQLALYYATDQCDRGTAAASCSFVDGQATSAYTAPSGCVASTVAYNNTANKGTLEVEWSTLRGTQFSVGGALTVGKGPVEVSFTANHTWVNEESVSEHFTLELNPHQFGWVSRAPVVRQTVGHWRITLAGSTWTVPGQNISFTSAKPAVSLEASATPPIQAECAR